MYTHRSECNCGRVSDSFMKPKLILPIEISYLRMAAQLLLPSLHKNKVEEVVDHILAMQGQQVYSFPHAVLLRSQNTNFSDVKIAFEHKKIVRHRPMRGTVHITCAKDYHWIRITLNQRPSAFILREESLAGVSESIFQEAAEIAWDGIINSHDVGIARKELFAHWVQHFKNKLTGEVSEIRFCQVLMWGLDRRGLLVEGPLRKNQHLFIDGRTLPAADSTESGFCLCEGDNREDALAEVAYRYVRGHGPISVADLARWASMNKKAARKALESNVFSGKLKRYKMTEEGIRDCDCDSNSDSIYYMHPQIMDTLEIYRDEVKQILFLPAFDELHVGYENRTCLTDEAGEIAICPAKNGMFKPLVVQDGRLIAVFPKEGLQWLKTANLSLQRAVNEVIKTTQVRMTT